jgi:DNA repair protein RadC
MNHFELDELIVKKVNKQKLIIDETLDKLSYLNGTLQHQKAERKAVTKLDADDDVSKIGELVPGYFYDSELKINENVAKFSDINIDS